MGQAALKYDQAFEVWVTPHLDKLSRISRSFAAPADQADLFQELLIAVWKARPAFRGDSSEATFIYRVAHNRAISWKRRQGVNLLNLLRARQDIALEAADTCRGSEEEQLTRLYAAIRQLPVIDRSLILLSLEGLSYAEMSALHGLNIKTISVRLTRARARLVELTKEVADGL